MIVSVGRWVVVAVVAALIGIQFAPYGRQHGNPVVRAEPAWDSPRTRALAVRACYDCHSNETSWPWYSNVAPMSWLVQYDVDQGRRELNYSEFDRPQGEARDSAETVQNGSMPPGFYTWLHSDAALTPAERDELIRGLQATFGGARAR
jgi:hypothetical protein